jgi:hypothetical protein
LLAVCLLRLFCFISVGFILLCRRFLGVLLALAWAPPCLSVCLSACRAFRSNLAKVLLLEPIVERQWNPNVPIVGTHCCAAMTWDDMCTRMSCDASMFWNLKSARMTQDTTVTSDHVSATTTYVTWREHVWKVSVLQRVHFFSILCLLHRASVLSMTLANY